MPSSKTRSYTYDLPLDFDRSPQRGDYIRHTSTVRRQVSWFIIIEARPIDSNIWGNRWKLTVRRLTPRDIDARPWAHPDFTVWPSTPAEARGGRP